jgi:Tol biopolymer transport system component
MAAMLWGLRSVRSRLGRQLIAVLAATTALALSATPADAAFPGENGKIAYACGGICTINPDGTGQTTLITYGGEPAWSPDGSKIAFTVLTPDQHGRIFGGIYVMNADGSGFTSLTTSADNRYPAWSPDGSKIVFSRFESDLYPASYDLYTMNADGTQLTKLTSQPTYDLGPSWDPSGTRIAYACGPDLCIIRPDGTGLTNLVSNSGQYSFPDWSPDGTKIAFSSPAGSGYLIFTINADGTGRTQITNPLDENVCPFCATIHSHPAWAPDGTRVAFSESGQCNISPSSCVGAPPAPVFLKTMNPDGSGQEQLAEGSRPDWQPLPPSPADFKNISKFCEAERERLGDSAFATRYGGNANAANAHGQCVAANSSSR